MNYPQAFIVMHPNFKMPKLEVLKAWAEGSQVYAHGESNLDQDLLDTFQELSFIEESIVLGENRQGSFLVINCYEVPRTIRAFLSEYIVQIYWLTDERKLNELASLNTTVCCFDNFMDSISACSDLLGEISEYIRCQYVDNSITIDDPSDSYPVNTDETESDIRHSLKQAFDAHFKTNLMDEERIFSIKEISHANL